MSAPSPVPAPDAAVPPPGKTPLPLVWRLVLLAALAVVLSACAAGWLVSRAMEQEVLRSRVAQQTSEVEVLARLLASKIEQHQRLLRGLAQGITAGMLESPATLEAALRHGGSTVSWFEALQVVRRDGELRLSLRAGRTQPPGELVPVERDLLRHTLADGKPLVTELPAEEGSEARVMFTLPLHPDHGPLQGVLAGTVKLQSQGLLPAAMVLSGRTDARLVVFAQDGTILAHSDPARILGHVRDEPGLGPVYAEWREQAQPVVEGARTQVLPGHIVSLAGMPLPQWMVARVSDAPALLAPLEEAQRDAGALVASTVVLALVLLTAAMVALARPLARLHQAAGQRLRRHAGEGQAWPLVRGEVGDIDHVLQFLDRQEAQGQARQAALSDQLEAILAHASVGIVITRQGRLDVVGLQTCRMLGYALRELQGQPARVLYASDADYAQTGQRVQAEFAAHGAFDGDLCFRHKDGSPVWVRVQGRGVHPADREGGTVWILEDLTAARLAPYPPAWGVALDLDPLTQLPHREAFVQALGRRLAARAQRGPEAAALHADLPGDGVLLFLDLDHFALVNGVAGHDAGDDVLRHVARLLESRVRQIGWAARLGGDKFAVLLPACTLARGQAVAEQLRVAVQAWEPSYQGHSFTLSLSIGLVLLDDSLPQVAAVLHAADMACYDARRAGGNRVQTHPVRPAPVRTGR
ncbi:MAG: diguanylate cyclase [Burkholderiaceae bacterium]|nr:diguanylate cyclase [Burkholderiaceae bacterium]